MLNLEDEIYGSVRAYLEKRCVALMVELTRETTEFYLYSGSILEIGDNWVWLTAGHCVDGIAGWLAHPGTRIAFCSLAEKGKQRVDLARANLGMVNMQDRLREYRLRWPDVAITDRDIELYDIGFAPVPKITQLYLMNNGVQPFRVEECLPDVAEVMGLARTGRAAGIFVGGIPDRSHKLNEEKLTLEFEFFVYPLHPDPDTPLDGDDRRMIRFEGQYTWIPSGWANLTGDIVGVSGSPVVIYIEEKFFLVGIATMQEPGWPRTPDYVGVTSSQMTIELLTSILNAGQMPGL